jgi:uncharacterized protein YndB with AHSA1/START domain
MTRIIALVVLLCATATATAELRHSEEHGFATVHVLETAAPPDMVWRTMTAHIDQWWSPEHTWSGDATHLYMDVGYHGCFCERLPEGGHVEHMHIIYFAPHREVRFDGALGPLQSMAVQGRMIWTVEPTESGSRITFTYKVFGHPEGGLIAIAPAVDAVIGEQLQRLGQRLAEE